MAHHQHVEMFLECVAGVRPCGIGAAWKHVCLAADFDDVWRVTSSSTFCMKGVNGPTLDCGDGVFNEAGFIKGVGVDADLHIHLIGNRKTGVNGGRGGAPIFMQLEAACSSAYLLF